MNNKNIFILLVFFIFALQFLYAEPVEKPFMGPGPQPDEHKLGLGTEGVLNFSKELGLTDEQIAKLKEIREKSKKEVFNLRNEIKTSIWDIQDELKKSNADKNKINNLVDKVSDNQKKLMKIRIEQFFEVKKILTEEQFKKLSKLIEERKKEFKKKFNKKFEKKQ